MSTAPKRIRHIDKGVLLVSFVGKVLGVCPNCDGPALVTSQLKRAVPFVPTHSRVNCLRCSFQLVPDGKWLGPVKGLAKARCPNCGFKWLKRELRLRRLNNRASQRVSISCPSCEMATMTPIQWTRERFDSPVDPVAGLPLWLKWSCCGQTLWAYNGEHLNKLRAYVAASLRERTANKHLSMFARLPQWMTAGKNREAVLSSINRLEKKLALVKA